MGFFSKKKKPAPARTKSTDIGGLFQQNRRAISRAEIRAADIDRQFVKTQTRFFLTVGEIDCPSGRIVVSDPLCYLAAGKMCPELAIPIPAGRYPVEVSICRSPHIGIRMCTARLKVRDTKAVRYRCAEPTEDSAAAVCSDGVPAGFPVEAGMMSFCDAQVASEYRNFLGRWYTENPGRNHYDDYFAAFFAESARALPAYQREDGDFIEWANPDSGRRLVMVASGLGDGFYQSFWGYDERDEICELIVPMVDPDLFGC